MKAIALQFGLLILALAALLHLTKYALFTQPIAEEGLTILFATVFLALGLWISRRFWPAPKIEKEKEMIIVKDKLPQEDLREQIKKSGISKREYEVLQLIAGGLSNQEIAAKLFISESTVKSHVSRLLAKLDAQRRTQAVSKAQKRGIL